MMLLAIFYAICFGFIVACAAFAPDEPWPGCWGD